MLILTPILFTLTLSLLTGCFDKTVVSSDEGTNTGGPFTIISSNLEDGDTGEEARKRTVQMWEFAGVNGNGVGMYTFNLQFSQTIDRGSKEGSEIYDFFVGGQKIDFEQPEAYASHELLTVRVRLWTFMWDIVAPLDLVGEEMRLVINAGLASMSGELLAEPYTIRFTPEPHFRLTFAGVNNSRFDGTILELASSIDLGPLQPEASDVNLTFNQEADSLTLVNNITWNPADNLEVFLAGPVCGGCFIVRPVAGAFTPGYQYTLTVSPALTDVFNNPLVHGYQIKFTGS